MPYRYHTTIRWKFQQISETYGFKIQEVLGIDNSKIAIQIIFSQEPYDDIVFMAYFDL